MEDINVVNDTQQAVVEPAQDGGADTNGTTAEPAARKQSSGVNSGFRKMRLENEQYRAQIESLKGTVAELEKLKEFQKTSDIYLERLVADRMERDLKEIQKSDPSVTDLASLGDDFLRLLESGIDAGTAYFAIKQAAENKKTKKPPTLNAMNTLTHENSAYFSSRELDRLSARDLENPKIFKKAMESLKKL